MNTVVDTWFGSSKRNPEALPFKGEKDDGLEPKVLIALNA